MAPQNSSKQWSPSIMSPWAFRNLPSARTTGMPSRNWSPGQSWKSTSGPINCKGEWLSHQQLFKAKPCLGCLHPWSWLARDEACGLA